MLKNVDPYLPLIIWQHIYIHIWNYKVIFISWRGAQTSIKMHKKNNISSSSLTYFTLLAEPPGAAHIWPGWLTVWAGLGACPAAPGGRRISTLQGISHPQSNMFHRFIMTHMCHECSQGKSNKHFAGVRFVSVLALIGSSLTTFGESVKDG